VQKLLFLGQRLLSNRIRNKDSVFARVNQLVLGFTK